MLLCSWVDTTVAWCIFVVQEAELSQRDCVMLCVIEYFAKSLEVM